MTNNKKAVLVHRIRRDLSPQARFEAVLWRLPTPVPGSQHGYKYRYALIVDDLCVLRYDNERGKGDHRHLQNREESYEFTTPEALYRDFITDIRRILK